MLKAKIVDEGFLQVERAGVFNGQHCPRDTEVRNCRYWCPLFGEVEHEYIIRKQGIDEIKSKTGKKTLTICENKTFEVVE